MSKANGHNGNDFHHGDSKESLAKGARDYRGSYHLRMRNSQNQKNSRTRRRLEKALSELNKTGVWYFDPGSRASWNTKCLLEEYFGSPFIVASHEYLRECAMKQFWHDVAVKLRAQLSILDMAT